MFRPQYEIRLSRDRLEARDRKSDARVSLTLDITLDSQSAVTDVGGANPEGRSQGTTHRPFSTAPDSDAQIKMANAVLTHTIRELDLARKGRFLGFSLAPDIHFTHTREMDHLVEYLRSNAASYRAHSVSVVVE